MTDTKKDIVLGSFEAEITWIMRVVSGEGKDSIKLKGGILVQKCQGSKFIKKVSIP